MGNVLPPTPPKIKEQLRCVSTMWGAPFKRIAVDVAGHFPTAEDGNKYILVAMGYVRICVDTYAYELN